MYPQRIPKRKAPKQVLRGRGCVPHDGDLLSRISGSTYSIFVATSGFHKHRTYWPPENQFFNMARLAGGSRFMAPSFLCCGMQSFVDSSFVE